MAPPSRARHAAASRDTLALAQAMHRHGRLAEAERLYRELLRANPRDADATHLLGLIALQERQAEKGVRLIEKALALRPDYPQALGNLAIGYAEMGRLGEALTSCDKALKLQPDLAELHDSRGNILREQGRHEAAVASFDRAIALRPDDPGPYNNRGNALRDLRRLAEAVASYDHAVGLQPGFVEARCNRAIVLQAMNRHEDALAGFDAVIVRTPCHAEAHYGRGNVLQDLRRFGDALAGFDRAIALRPDYAEAWNSRGNALHDLRRQADALASFGKAIALAPDYAAPHYNLGNTLASMRHEASALPHFARAIALNPDNAQFHRALGLALAALKRYPDALASYQRASELAPDTPWLFGERLSVKRQICAWDDDASELHALAEAIACGRRVAAPFIVAGLLDSPPLQRRAAEIFTEAVYPPSRAEPLARYGGHARIRIGYFSADFHDHAMMHVMSGLFGSHDRSRFEVTAFSFGGPRPDDPWRQRVVAAFDRFVEVDGMPDRDVVALARTIELDIAVDLMGLTLGCRPGIFARRAAPVQVSYLGYPGTMGTGYIDYLIADRTVVPPGAERHYTEKIVFMPDSYQVNTRDHPICARLPRRQDEGLPESDFVFCCFNNNHKITPAVFDLWMGILRRVERSVLWLYGENPFAADRLRRTAAASGIAAERVILAGKLPLAEHLARQGLADLFLDTLPYTGHATASLALWAGVPVLTQMGSAFAGRVAASLLNAAGLPELVVETAHEYQTLAVRLAEDRPLHQALRTKVRSCRLTAPLFDTARFARSLEAAFRTMHARAQAGLQPAEIDVGALRDRQTVHNTRDERSHAQSKQDL